MVTVVPGAAVLLAAGFSCQTLPGPVPAGPATVCALTLKPALCSDVCALCSLRPTTFGTLAAPETKMVTLDPGSTMVLPTGFWFTTVPAVWVDVRSCWTTTLKPSFCKVVSAAASGLPSTLGTATLLGPDETYNVTTVFAATLLPPGGLELITRPCLTPDDVWLTTVKRRCWARICCSAVATGSPFTGGTA